MPLSIWIAIGIIGAFLVAWLLWFFYIIAGENERIRGLFRAEELK